MTRITLREIVKWLRRKRVFPLLSLRGVGEMLLLARALPGSAQSAALRNAFTEAGFSQLPNALVGDAITIEPGNVVFKHKATVLVQFGSAAAPPGSEAALVLGGPEVGAAGPPPSLALYQPPSFVRTLTYAAAAYAAREPVLLVGPSGHKSTAVASLAHLLGRSSELTVVHLTPETEAGDLLGQIVPMGIAQVRSDYDCIRAACA